mgnify:CR=1 FL=1
MEKLDYLYSDERDDLFNIYKDQKESSIKMNFKLNIANLNDYVTDELIGEGGFKPPLETFYTVLSICLAMVKLKEMDEYFFEEIIELSEKYKNGEFDNCFFDIETDKKEIDKDLETVLNYYNEYKMKPILVEIAKILWELPNMTRGLGIAIINPLDTEKQAQEMLKYLKTNRDNEKLMRSDNLLKTTLRISKENNENN